MNVKPVIFLTGFFIHLFDGSQRAKVNTWPHWRRRVNGQQFPLYVWNAPSRYAKDELFPLFLS